MWYFASLLGLSLLCTVLSCPSGWYRFNRLTCYKKIPKRQFYSKGGRTVCADMGAHMMSVHSEDDIVFAMLRFIPDCANFTGPESKEPTTSRIHVGLVPRETEWEDGTEYSYGIGNVGSDCIQLEWKHHGCIKNSGLSWQFSPRCSNIAHVLCTKTFQDRNKFPFQFEEDEIPIKADLITSIFLLFVLALANVAVLIWQYNNRNVKLLYTNYRSTQGLVELEKVVKQLEIPEKNLHALFAWVGNISFDDYVKDKEEMLSRIDELFPDTPLTGLPYNVTAGAVAAAKSQQLANENSTRKLMNNISSPSPTRSDTPKKNGSRSTNSTGERSTKSTKSTKRSSEEKERERSGETSRFLHSNSGTPHKKKGSPNESHETDKRTSPDHSAQAGESRASPPLWNPDVNKVFVEKLIAKEPSRHSKYHDVVDRGYKKSGSTVPRKFSPHR